MSISTLLLIVACICFLLSAIPPAASRIGLNLIGIGLFLWTLSILIAGSEIRMH